MISLIVAHGDDRLLMCALYIICKIKCFMQLGSVHFLVVMFYRKIDKTSYVKPSRHQERCAQLNIHVLIVTLDTPHQKCVCHAITYTCDCIYLLLAHVTLSKIYFRNKYSLDCSQTAISVHFNLINCLGETSYSSDALAIDLVNTALCM